MGEAEVRKLALRLEELERINHRNERAYRKWKRIGVALLGCTLIVAITGAADQKPTIVEAKEFVLRDESKFIRASLAIRSDGTPGFALYDKNGKARLEIDLSPEEEGSLNLSDGSGILRAAVALRPDGTPGIGLFGTKGQIRASLDIGRDGTSGFNVYDDAGKLRAAMALRPDATPALGLFDEDGRVQHSIEPTNESPAVKSETPTKKD